ncbi:hypothetical protein D3C86_1602480 [compost metagenome]
MVSDKVSLPLLSVVTAVQVSATSQLAGEMVTPAGTLYLSFTRVSASGLPTLSVTDTTTVLAVDPLAGLLSTPIAAPTTLASCSSFNSILTVLAGLTALATCAVNWP